MRIYTLLVHLSYQRKFWRKVIVIFAGISLSAFSTSSDAHAFAPSVLQLRELDSNVFEVKWKIPVKQLVHTSPQLPETCTRVSDALKNVEGTGKVATWQVRCNEGIIGEDIGVSFSGLGKERSTAFVQVEFLDKYSISEILTSDNPTFTISQKPGRLKVVDDYARVGIEHILVGFDHLLFVFGLLLLVGINRQLFWTVTAFTVGHSITLGIAALDFISVPQAPVEAFIAFSIYVLGIEIIRTNQGKASWFRSRPWLIAGGFGLLHGLGFAGALSEIGLPPYEIPLSLFAFNLGIEIGQLIFIFVVMVCWGIFKSVDVTVPMAARQMPAYFIGACAVFWTIERTVSLFS